MKSYYLTNSILHIHRLDGSTLVIFLSKDSGKVYYLFKINTVSQIKHTGIYLGTDKYGVHYIMHNHHENGRPCIVTLDLFIKGQELYEFLHTPENEPLRVLEIGLNEILRGEAYHSIDYNCQTFINIACINRRKSDDVEKWMERIALGSLIFLGITVITAGKR